MALSSRPNRQAFGLITSKSNSTREHHIRARLFYHLQEASGSANTAHSISRLILVLVFELTALLFAYYLLFFIQNLLFRRTNAAHTLRRDATLHDGWNSANRAVSFGVYERYISVKLSDISIHLPQPIPAYQESSIHLLLPPTHSLLHQEHPAI